MRYFPQLSTGAVGQFPVRKRRLSRTIVNDTLGGETIKLADPDAAAVEWILDFQALTDTERDSLTQLFTDVEGRLGNFAFLDPTDNLLCWSEKLDEPVWERNSLLTIAAGIEDPEGGLSANRITNGGAGALGIQQTVNGPGWFRYAFSVHARSDQGQELRLYRSTATQTQSGSFRVGPDWRRIVLSGKFSGSEQSLIFGAEIAAGRSVDLYGIQVEAQPGASGYKKTLSNCAVYPQSRFLDDALEVTTEGPGQHSCRVRIRARA